MSENKIYIRDFLSHSFYLVITVLLVWLWVNNPVLTNYNLQLTAVLVLFYFLFHFLFSKKGSGSANLILDAVVFTAILLLILTPTGGLNSPFFFLVYFLLFAAALLFNPAITLTLTLALTLYFANSLNSIHAALQLLSLLFITPLAIFFGKQYLRLLESQEKIKVLSKRTRLLSLQGDALEASIKREETDSLLWLTLNFKNGLLKIVHQVSELLSDISHLTLTQKEKLQSIHETAKELLKSGEKLKQKIDKETD